MKKMRLFSAFLTTLRHIDNVRQHSSATSVADHETPLESCEGSFGRKPHLQASIPLAVLSLKP